MDAAEKKILKKFFQKVKEKLFSINFLKHMGVCVLFVFAGLVILLVASLIDYYLIGFNTEFSQTHPWLAIWTNINKDALTLFFFGAFLALFLFIIVSLKKNKGVLLFTLIALIAVSFFIFSPSDIEVFKRTAFSRQLIYMPCGALYTLLYVFVISSLPVYLSLFPSE